jgi:NNP family nitrate/nitrite transporter-like MFS transporter
VWRFGLAYYFVFGGFVALALWLPKYYVGEYGLPLATAAFLTICSTLPSGAIRALGGWASDKWGGNQSPGGCSGFQPDQPVLPQLSADHHDRHSRHQGRCLAQCRSWASCCSPCWRFVVGMAQGFGKASVYRSLADYYPNSMGVVGGIVGVIGGLGGFTMPIMFGVAADAIGVRSSCFMLMFAAGRGHHAVDLVGREEMSARRFLERHADARAELAGANLIEHGATVAVI